MAGHPWACWSVTSHPSVISTNWLVADAQAAHDPDDRLAAAAATLSELALDEPATGLGHDGEFVLTGAQIACLEAFGIEFSDTPTIGDHIGIPQNVADECLVEAHDSDGTPG